MIPDNGGTPATQPSRPDHPHDLLLKENRLSPGFPWPWGRVDMGSLICWLPHCLDVDGIRGSYR